MQQQDGRGVGGARLAVEDLDSIDLNRAVRRHLVSLSVGLFLEQTFCHAPEEVPSSVNFGDGRG